jgi:hypothetical protein
LDIDVDWYDWSLENEQEFDVLYRKLLNTYCRKPL